MPIAASCSTVRPPSVTPPAIAGGVTLAGLTVLQLAAMGILLERFYA